MIKAASELRPQYKVLFHLGAATLAGCLARGFTPEDLILEIETYRDLVVEGLRTGGRLQTKPLGAFERSWQTFIKMTSVGEATANPNLLEIYQGAFYLGAHYLVCMIGAGASPVALTDELMAYYHTVNVPGVLLPKTPDSNRGDQT